MDNITPTPHSNPFLRFLKVLWRLFLLVVTGLIIGGLLYLGFSQFYNNVVQVGQTTAGRMSAAETLSVLEQSQITGRVDTLSQRLAAIEKQQSQQQENVSDLQGRTRLLEQAVDDQSVVLKKVDILESRLATLETDLKKNTQEDQTLEDDLTANDAPLAQTQRDLQVLKAMELIGRARLNLIQNNAGLARTDVESARQILALLYDKTPADQQALVSTWLQRLDLVLNNLPTSPVLAADDLEIAWRLLSEGWVAPTVTPTASGVTPTLEITPTQIFATPSMSVTPTP
jgi:hypothetical protein